MSPTPTEEAQLAAPPAHAPDQQALLRRPQSVLRANRRRVVALVAGGVMGLLALTFLAAGGWALTKDHLGRDGDGFLTVVSGQAQTGAYALTSELRGDGPGWLYGSDVFGEARFHASSQNGKSLFIGVARTADVSRYLSGTGYATIEHLDAGTVTSHSGGAPTSAPAQLSIWAASTQGVGQQTLRWRPRDGDWSIVVMNVDATAGVAVGGDVSATAPILPWLTLGLLLGAGLLGGTAAWLLLRALRSGARALDRRGAASPQPATSGIASGASR